MTPAPPAAPPGPEAVPEISSLPVAEAWEALLSAALVGTARRPAPPAALAAVALVDPAPAPGLHGDPAGALLASAAVLAAYRRAGRLPGGAPAVLPGPAEPDHRPPCSDAAVEVLELILSGEVPIPGGSSPLAGEWLAGAARAGCRLPARLLPRLLDLGSAAPELRWPLRAVAGPRGRWLAGHGDRWSWAADPLPFERTPEPATPISVADSGALGAAAPGADAPGAAAGPGGAGEADDEELRRRYATASRSDRLALLEAVRRVDPRRGRDLLASTWRRDPAGDRGALVGLLAIGLSDDDEPFLDAALDDRSAGVRAVVAELLARLPGSRRSTRMAARLRALVGAGSGPPDAAVRPGRGGRSRRSPAKPAFRGSGVRNSGAPVGAPLGIGRPAEPDAAARRDHITDDAPAGMGLSAWWVAQVVAGAPLSFWGNELGLAAAEVVEQAAGVPELLGGLEYAVVAQVGSGRADPAWGQAMFAARPTPAVLGALPPGLAATELAGLLARGLAPRQNVGELFAAVPGPWPAELAAAVVGRYRQLGDRAAFETPATLPVLATRLDPAALPLVETWLFTLAGEPATRRRVQSLAHALSLRAVIHREFPL